MSNTVLVGCRIPQGLKFLILKSENKLSLINDDNEWVYLNGSSESNEIKMINRYQPTKSHWTIILNGYMYGMTYVDQEKWEYIKKTYKDFIKKNLGKSIIEGKSEKDLMDRVKGTADDNILTGFEPVKQDSHGVITDPRN